MDGQVSLNELTAAALEAEGKNVPVDWKTMYFQAVNLANNYIAGLEAQVSAADRNPDPSRSST